VVGLSPPVRCRDKDGKVADVHVGYSPHLFEEVTAVVDRLLGRISQPR
jgi:hypothetical protein